MQAEANIASDPSDQALGSGFNRSVASGAAFLHQPLRRRSGRPSAAGSPSQGRLAVGPL